MSWVSRVESGNIVAMLHIVTQTHGVKWTCSLVCSFVYNVLTFRVCWISLTTERGTHLSYSESCSISWTAVAIIILSTLGAWFSASVMRVLVTSCAPGAWFSASVMRVLVTSRAHGVLCLCICVYVCVCMCRSWRAHSVCLAWLLIHFCTTSRRWLCCQRSQPFWLSFLASSSSCTRSRCELDIKQQCHAMMLMDRMCRMTWLMQDIVVWFRHYLI